MNKQTKHEIILGIDPGYGRTGWGVIEKEKGEWKVIDWGCIETSVKDPFVDRLVELYKELQKILKKYKPTRVGVEELFFAKNVKTAMKVGQARGVILLTFLQVGLPVDEFNPLQIKQALTGYGRAEKGQVEKMVKMILKISKKIRPDDAADALAIAITCGESYKMRQKMKK